MAASFMGPAITRGYMPRKIQESVVVITGASSGIGRATALEFARRGARVVLAARREQPLLEVASQCATVGGEALVVPTDVTDEAAVQELARRAVERFGRLDVWVNNAAVTSFGLFEDTPQDVFRRIIDTNLFGYVHGARAALGQSLPAPGAGHGQQRRMDATWPGSRGPRRPAWHSRRGARRPGPPVAASAGALPCDMSRRLL